jgi:6-phosphogluconate dehydrogenase
MIHNGIEYGIMAAYAEGIGIPKAADAGKSQSEIDAETTPLRDPEHYQYDKAAIDEGVPVPVLTTALYERFSSRGEADYADRLLSAMRFGFGGHLEKSAT